MGSVWLYKERTFRISFLNFFATSPSIIIEFITGFSSTLIVRTPFEKLVDIFENFKCPLILMHTVSTYPASESDLNLKCIKTLSSRYDLPVGYSGHETNTAPSIFAAVLGHL